MSEKKFEDRQRQSMADFRRSAWQPGDKLPDWATHVRVDAYSENGKGPYFRVTPIVVENPEAQRQRQQAEAIRQMNADMADLVEFAKQGEFRESDAGS
jgi:hypothetical protein